MPLVATSGNLAGEPIAIDNGDARRRLGSIADLFAVHDRPIARPCDDSVVRVGAQGLSPVRRARGYAPLPIHVGVDLPKVLAVGGHLKNTVAIAVGRDVIVSQHIGDLDTLEARRGFELAIADFCRMHRFTPELVVADLHPDYASTRWAVSSGYPARAGAASRGARRLLRGRERRDRAVPRRRVGRRGLRPRRDRLGRRVLPRRRRSLHARRAPAAVSPARRRRRREGGWRVALAMDWVARGAAALDGRPDAQRARSRPRTRRERPELVERGTAVRRGGGGHRDFRSESLRGGVGDGPRGVDRPTRAGRLSLRPTI